ncbi:MAG: hypothetical protein ACOCXQ_04295 [Patescibacteria group bacterium]
MSQQVSRSTRIVILLYCVEFLLLILYGYNLFVYLWYEPEYTLILTDTSLFHTLRSSLAAPPCSPAYPYVVCGIERIIFLIGIPILIIVGLVLSITEQTRSMKARIEVLVQSFSVLLIHLVLPMVSGVIILGGMIWYADHSIDTFVQTVKQDSAFITDLGGIKDELSEPDAYMVRESIYGLTQAIAIADDRPVQERDSFYYRVMIPLSIEMYNHDVITGLPAAAYAKDAEILFVFQTNQTILQELAPIISQSILRRSFGSYIDYRPHSIKVLDKDDYVSYQEQRIVELEEQYNEYLEYLRTEIGRVNAYLSENQTILANLSPNDPYASDVQALIERYSLEANDYKSGLEQQLVIAERSYQDFKNNPVSPEIQAGVYLPPDQIVIRYFERTESAKGFLHLSFSQYLYTILHEQLHLFSSGPSSGLDVYLEEGITDYLATRTIRSYMGYEEILDDSYAGYPYEIRVVKQLLSRIPEEELLRVYFKNDPEGFRVLFLSYYPSVDYEEFRAAATALSYSAVDDDLSRENAVARIQSILATESQRQSVRE